MKKGDIVVHIGSVLRNNMFDHLCKLVIIDRIAGNKAHVRFIDHSGEFVVSTVEVFIKNLKPYPYKVGDEVEFKRSISDAKRSVFIIQDIKGQRIDIGNGLLFHFHEFIPTRSTKISNLLTDL